MEKTLAALLVDAESMMLGTVDHTAESRLLALAQLKEWGGHEWSNACLDCDQEGYFSLLIREAIS